MSKEGNCRPMAGNNLQTKETSLAICMMVLKASKQNWASSIASSTFFILISNDRDTSA